MTIGRHLLAARRLFLCSTMLAGAIPVTHAIAADQPVLKAPPVEVANWYFFGGFEAGVRLVDDPPSGYGRAPPPINWLTPLTTDSRAKFEEYGDVPRGVFLDWINLQAGTTDGRYAIDFWGRSVGVNNQSYSVDAAVVGEHYFTIGWGQTPHLISTSAKSLFVGEGSGFLTVPNGVQAALQAQLPNAALAAPPPANGVLGQTARNNIENIINGAVHPLELSTLREKGVAGWRYTPNTEWDISVDYSREERSGTRPVGVPYGWGTGASPRPTNVVEAPQPLQDVTQNVDAQAEYLGTLLGTRWLSSVKYSGSFYNNDINFLDIENPFCITCNPLAGANRGPNLLRLGLAPDNDAQGVTWNTAVDLPFWKSRYVSTVQYNVMRQNDLFVPGNINGLVAPPVTFLGVPVSSLDGRVDTFLWNNVYTAQITKDLKMTMRGRHYDVNNQTPSLHIENWLFGDSGCASGAPNPLTGVCSIGNARNSLPISYTKDNASTEFAWRPVRWAMLGAGGYWERYDRKFRDVNVTDELMGKVWVDTSPFESLRARGSYLYAQRRYDEYNTAEFVEVPGLQFSEVVTNLRRFDVANRNRQKADAALEWSPNRYITVSPNAGFRWDDYPDPVANPLGVRHDHTWNAGIEIGAMINSNLKLMAAYNYEERQLDMAGGSGGANLVTGSPFTGCPTSAVLNPDHVIGTSCTWQSDIHQRYHTFMAAADWKVVPSTFDLRFEYLYARGTEANNTTPCSAPNFVGVTPSGTNCNGLATTGAPATLVNPASVNFGQFPTETNTFQRYNVIGKYYVDSSLVRQMGFTGDVILKLRYTWEQNESSNWAIDNMTPYVPTPDTTELTGAARSVFLAAFNPNYTAQLVAASVMVKW